MRSNRARPKVASTPENRALRVTLSASAAAVFMVGVLFFVRTADVMILLGTLVITAGLAGLAYATKPTPPATAPPASAGADAVRCGACHAPNPVHARYCNACGRAMT